MQTFTTKSPIIKDIIKALELSKDLFVSSILIGEPHTGKKSLLKKIFPSIPIVSATNKELIHSTLKISDEIIITNFDILDNIKEYDFENKKIIATANKIKNKNLIDEMFAFIYHMPSLQERPEDIDILAKYYLDKAIKDLSIKEIDVDIDKISIDLSNNTKTLKSSIYRYLIQKDMNIDEIKNALYEYLYNHLEGNNSYREHIHIYEEPLIKAGLDKFSSQLKLSSILGINRNTLRKKIQEHNLDA